MDCGDRIFVVLWSPGKFPARAANGPGAKTNRRYLQIGVPKFSRFHLNPLTEARSLRSRLTLICCLFLSQNWMNKKREKLKLRRKKTERKDSVSRKSSVARSSFAIGIGDTDLLRLNVTCTLPVNPLLGLTETLTAELIPPCGRAKGFAESDNEKSGGGGGD